MSKLTLPLRPTLLATLSLTVALAGCATNGAGTKTSGGTAPQIASASLEDPMLAAAPPSGIDANGSRRVPLGQLASNAQPASAPPAPSGNGPAMLVPPPSAGSTLDPMSAPPPPAAAAPKPATAPAPTPVAAAPTPPMVLTATPQPETLSKMGKAPAKAEPAKAEPPKPEPVKVEVAKIEPKAEPKVEAPAAAKPAVSKPVPPTVSSNLDQAVALAGPASGSSQMKLNIPPKGAPPTSFEPSDTVVISSTNTQPVRDTREFIPAMVASNSAPMLTLPTPPAPNAPGGMVSRPLSAAEKNVAQRFENLKMLLDQGLITPEEYVRHRSANIGALLPYSHDPGAVGLERPVPSGDALVARLEALRRSLEVRAISTKQHAMERGMIISALLPETPTERMNPMPPPEDVIQAATIISHLQTLRARNLVSADEFNAEKNAIESYLRTGNYKPQATAKAEPAKAAGGAAKKVDVAAKAETEASAAADELTAPVPGPVLHLASFRSQDAAKKAWAEALDRNKALLGQVKPVIRRIDLGAERGVFYRLMAGPYASLPAAETACQSLKQNNQFCRASADGS